MSLTRVLSSGSGAVAWRMSIDGMPYEAVSHRGMEGTASDNRVRYVGLRSEGLRFSESVHLPLSKWEAQGQRITIVDVDQRWTELFCTVPQSVTYLADNAASGDSVITVLSTSSFPETNGRIYLDGETIDYVSTTATTFNGCSRGRHGSLPTAHYETFGAHLRAPEITDWPVGIEGRRVRVFAYGAGDDKQGDGTQVWVGVARTEPAFDGTRWSFVADPLSSIFDFELGADLEDPRSIRGIYYPWTAPLVVGIVENGISTIAAMTECAIAGFWETQEAFCTALSAAIATAVSSGNTIRGTFTQGPFIAEPRGDSWCIKYTTTSTGDRYIQVGVNSSVDGTPSDLLDNETSVTVPFNEVEPSKTYRVDLLPTANVPNPGAVPRTSLLSTGGSSSYSAALGVNPTNRTGFDEATNPPSRLYLSGAAPSTAVTEASIEWPASTTDGDPISIVAPITDTDTANNSLTLDPRFLPAGGPFAASGPDAAAAVKLRMTRQVAEGNLRDMLEALVGDVSTYVTTGAVPFLRPANGGLSSDIDLDTDDGATPPTLRGGGVIDAAATGAGPVAEARKFTLLAPVKLRELIEHECRLLGIYPCSNASGQITFKRLALPTPTLTADGSFDASNIIVDDQVVAYERSPHGTYNSVVYRLGYDPLEDENTATPVLIRDVVSFGRHPQPRVLEVAPKTVDPDVPIPVEDLARLASRVLGVFGAPYAELTIEAPMTRFDRLLGDVVNVTWSKVPSGLVDTTAAKRGTLGVSNKIGIVIARDWEPMEAKGSVTILLTDQRVGGYVPSAKITDIDGTSGTSNTMTLTLDSAYFPSGTTAETWFAAGYKVRLFKWNSTDASLNVTAEVSTVTPPSGNVVTVKPDDAWTHSGATWCLGFDVSTAIVKTGQKPFVYIARADGGLDWSDETDQPAFTFGP